MQVPHAIDTGNEAATTATTATAATTAMTAMSGGIRRRLARFAAAACAVGLLAAPAVQAQAQNQAQSPAPAAQAADPAGKPIRFIVPTPTGSGPDVDMRQVADRLSKLLNQPVLVENRPGAAGRIATEAVVRSAPDGLTFLVATPTVAIIGPALYEGLPYNVQRDLKPVSLISTTAYALTVTANGPKDIADFVAQAKASPGKTNVGTVGLGSTTHLAGYWFSDVAKAPFEFVHYQTSTPYTDLVGGQINGVFEAILPIYGQVQAGRLRVIAITGKSRHPLLPNVPTFAEAGFAAYQPLVWIGVLAPAATPPAAVERVSRALAQVAKMPEIIAMRRDAFSDSIGSTPDGFASFLDEQRKVWEGVIRQTGIKLK